MSEFTCSWGHQVLPSIGYCPICKEQGRSGRITRMDGKTNRQLEAIERDWDRYLEDREVED